MRALTIFQPWAWAVLHGDKRVENRRRPTSYRGPFLIHAGRRRSVKVHCAAAAWIEHRTGLIVPAPWSLHFSGVVGQANLVKVITDSSSPWFAGPVGWILADVRPLPFIPCRGYRGWFDVPDDLIADALRR